MIDRATLEQIYEICTSRPRAAALRDLADLIADIEHAAMLADSIKITGKASGQLIEATKFAGQREQPFCGDPSEVTFRPVFEHTSTLNGQRVIAYDLIASQLGRAHEAEALTPEQIDAENKAYARQLNKHVADELKRINGK